MTRNKFIGVLDIYIFAKKTYMRLNRLFSTFLMQAIWYWTPEVRIGKDVRFYGVPIIDVVQSASLTIDENVTISSSSIGYHTNMHSPVKLVADRPGARIHIGAKTRIHGTCVHAQKSITIGKHCLIAANCEIFDSSAHDLILADPLDRISTDGSVSPIVIEDAVWIGANCIILPGSSIGFGSVVAAGSVVRGSYSSNSLIAGNPARFVRSLIDSEQELAKSMCFGREDAGLPQQSTQ